MGSNLPIRLRLAVLVSKTCLFEDLGKQIVLENYMKMRYC